MSRGSEMVQSTFIKWLNTLSNVPFAVAALAARLSKACEKSGVFSSERCTFPSAAVSPVSICPVGRCRWKAVLFFSALSDAFDFQFGAVVLRLKEGLDVSHIQGQGNQDSVPPFGDEAVLNVEYVSVLLRQEPCGVPQGFIPSSLLFSLFVAPGPQNCASHDTFVFLALVLKWNRFQGFRSGISHHFLWSKITTFKCFYQLAQQKRQYHLTGS